jgi:putative transposase
MPRTSRATVGGLVYHVLNRGNGRLPIFRKPGDYLAFVQLMIDAREWAEVEIFGFCLMTTHWHLVVRPRRDHDLAAYFSWLTNTHVKRYRAHYRRTSGHLYQGRYKSFVVQEDAYLLTLLRYVEANPLRAKMVERAQDWQWSSLGCPKDTAKELLDEWPIDRPRNWTALVNEPVGPVELKRLQLSFERGRPLGSDPWTLKMAGKMGLQYTLNPRGRPKLQESVQ